MPSASDGSSPPAPGLDVRLVIDAIPALAWSSHPDGAVEFVNQKWHDYTGLSPEESYGWGWKAAVHSEDLSVMLANWGGSPDLEETRESKVRLRRSDGAFHWFLLRREPLCDETGAVVRWFGTGIDVEEDSQKEMLRVAEKRTLELIADGASLSGQRSQEALRAALSKVENSEPNLRQVIDTIPALVWCMLPAGPNEFLNKRWHEYTGLSPEESQGRGYQAAYHPEDIPRVMERWQELVVSGEPGEIEARLRRHDGVYRWFLCRHEPFRDESGKIIRWYGTSTDIETLKQTQEKLREDERELRRITDAIPNPIVVQDPTGGPIYANQATLDYTGMTAKDVVAPNFRERIFHPDDLQRLRGERTAALVRGIPFEVEQRALRKDGQYRWFLIRYNPFRNEQGS